MSNISIIIPVHEYNENVSFYLDNAIKSVERQQNITDYPEILLVYAVKIEKEIREYLSSRFFDNKLIIKPIKNENKTDFQSQINLGVDNCSTEYFSILEFDDEYGQIYFKNVEKYLKVYPKTDIFLPLIIEVNSENQAVKITNEIVWSQQFIGENGEVGYLNQNVLNQYTDFKICGAVIKKQEYLNIGKLKSNIILAFNYEFLLRAINNASKIFTIPKIGYKHLITREGSLFDGYSKNMSMQERKFWFETAKKESHLFNDRVIHNLVLE